MPTLDTQPILALPTTGAPPLDPNTISGVVDHPDTWLEVLEYLPASPDRVARSAPAVHPGSYQVQDVMMDKLSSTASREFLLEFDGRHDPSSAHLSFSVNAGPDRVRIALCLIAAGAALREGGRLHDAFTAQLAALIATASRKVIAAFHRNLSEDLASTAITFYFVVPDQLDAALQSNVLARVSASESRGADLYSPRFVGSFADAELAQEIAAPAAERRYLAVAERLALAVNLTKFRESKGESQLQVSARALGFEKTHAAISRLERGILNRHSAHSSSFRARSSDIELAVAQRSKSMLK